MADFIITIDVLGDDAVIDGIINRSITEFKDDTVAKIGNYAFAKCEQLAIVDLPAVTTLGSHAFQACGSLTMFIIRGETVPNLAAANVFADCYHFLGTTNAQYNPNGAKDGYFYVPKALVDSYKTVTNWSSFADQFRALEDYTVDGTTTGELDETKI